MDGAPREAVARRERAARWATIALVLLVPAAFLPKVFGSQPEPVGIAPRWADLIVITTAAWPSSGERGVPAFDELRLAASRVDQCYAPSRSAAGAAVSLWTGRFPANHGVRSNKLALPPGAWTLARAEEASGRRTAAFLEDPFVSVTGIGGFEEVVEDADLGVERVLAAGTDFLASHPDERTCLWLHLSSPGDQAEALARLVTGIREHLATSTRRFTTLLVVTGLTRPGSPHADGRSRIPIYIQLPAGRAAGLEGRGAVNLADVAGALCELLALPLPSSGDAPLQSRGESLWANVNGGGGFDWQFLEGEHGDVLRFGKTRVAPDADGTLTASMTEFPAFDARFEPADPSIAPTLVEQYRVLHKRLEAGATEAIPVEAPAPWSGWRGW